MKEYFASAWMDGDQRVYIDNPTFETQELATAAVMLNNYKQPSIHHQIARIVLHEEHTEPTHE